MKFIDLINKMYRNQVETGFKFTLRYKEFTLDTYEIRECKYGLMIWDLDNDCRFDSSEYILDYLDYEVEIIEKDKDIEEVRLSQDKGNTLIGKNMWSFYYKINELVREVNKLKNK